MSLLDVQNNFSNFSNSVGVTDICISTNDVPVRGLASIDDELFVLLHRSINQIAVYSASNYKLLRHLHLPGFKPNVCSDMTSCVRYKCLYISDPRNNCIQKFDLSSDFGARIRWFVGRHISKWSVPGSPRGLSLTPSSLLVTCRGQTSKLVQLSGNSGRCLREITLQPDIVYPRHAVQLATGQFAVCHGIGIDLHRVCVVDTEGKVTRSYGGRRGSAVGELDCPRHLAVDTDSQFIYVAEINNNRVVMLSPTLEFVRDFGEDLSQPYRLHVHPPTGRLYVGQLLGGVSAIQL